MRQVVVFASLLALALPFRLVAEDKPAIPPSMTIDPAIARLIDQLNDKDYRIRASATKTLAERGPILLPSLRQAMTTTSAPEARARLQKLIQSLETHMIFSPKLITLDVENKLLSEVIADISKQTDYQLTMYGVGRDLRVTIKADKLPFWQVVDRVCQDVGLSLNHSDGNQMAFYANDQSAPYVCYFGPFRLVATNFYYNKGVNLAGFSRSTGASGIRSENLSFQFNIQAEPKLPLMSVSQPKLTEAVDDQGNSMLIPGVGRETTYYHGGGYRTYNYSTQVQLAWPVKEARSVRVLKGTVPVSVLAEQKPDVTITDLTAAKGKKFTGTHAELQIESVTEAKDKQSYQVKMVVRNLVKNTNPDYTWANSVHQRIELFDAKGNRYFPNGYNWDNNTPTTVNATFMFSSNGQPRFGPAVKLVYNHWTILPFEMPFEFRNLPLP